MSAILLRSTNPNILYAGPFHGRSEKMTALLESGGESKSESKDEGTTNGTRGKTFIDLTSVGIHEIPETISYKDTIYTYAGISDGRIYYGT